MSRLSGKKALVTAAGQGIGRAVAGVFSREGAEVIATDIRVSAVMPSARESGMEIPAFPEVFTKATHGSCVAVISAR